MDHSTEGKFNTLFDNLHSIQWQFLSRILSLYSNITPKHVTKHGDFLAKLEAEALTMTRGTRKLERMTSHIATHSAHTSHSTTKECLENAVGINIMESSTTASILKILTTIIHPPLLLITQDCIGFSNLKNIIKSNKIQGRKNQLKS